MVNSLVHLGRDLTATDLQNVVRVYIPPHGIKDPPYCDFIRLGAVNESGQLVSVKAR